MATALDDINKRSGTLRAEKRTAVLSSDSIKIFTSVHATALSTVSRAILNVLFAQYFGSNTVLCLAAVLYGGLYTKRVVLVSTLSEAVCA